ncbi:MAG: COR domain-containing protein, partial [Pirellulaceae bacterium]
MSDRTPLEAYAEAELRITACKKSGGTFLSLSDLGLNTPPPEIGQLKNLRELYLHGNCLTGLPPEIGQLQNLSELYLHDNCLTTLPTEIGQLQRLTTLTLHNNRLSSLLPETGQLQNLTTLSLFKNNLTVLPSEIGQLKKLTTLNLWSNKLTTLPKEIGNLLQLTELHLYDNCFTTLPKEIGLLPNLTTIGLHNNQLTRLPSEIGQLLKLKTLDLDNNLLTTLPTEIGQLLNLKTLQLRANPLTPELSAACKEGLAAVKAYLRAHRIAQIVLNEAKLILIGEGEVGKSSLLSALRGDEWVENRKTTHGVEVDIRSFILLDFKTEITFNGWDFGGQNIYRHTHQLFFTAPAIYLAVWNPRRGPEQCCVDEWIKMVRHRAYDETRPDDRPRILIVATHGGPHERSAHIDQQLLRDEFGDLIVGFHHVDSKTCFGLDELKTAIARTAASIPSVGRSVPKSWKNLVDVLRNRSEKEPYISYQQFQAICRSQGITDELANIYAAILNELGYLIHYRDDAELQKTVILKPEWLSKAISYVLEDKTVGEQNGLVQHNRLSTIWDDPQRAAWERYPTALHPVFLKLMERFDLSYRVVMPQAGAPETSLVAQLVPGGRPDGWERDWPDIPAAGDAQRTQVCCIVDAKTGKPAEVEGLLYRLIVRLHRYSLGRNNYLDSRHWKTGVILDDDYNGRAFIEELAGDVHVTVRAAYPERFLSHLCSEIEWLVDHFWKGLDCRHSVPCHAPCKGLHEVKGLVETKREGILKIRCSVCEKFHAIDSLLATVTPKPPIEEALAELKKGQMEIKRGMEKG